MSGNDLLTLLCDLGVCDRDSVEMYFPRVRDRDDISVMRCPRSGVIFLSRSNHLDPTQYESVDDFGYWGTGLDRAAAALVGLEDTQRRARRFQAEISGRKWLDVGTGAGGILDVLAPVAAETRAVEPQSAARLALAECGYLVHREIGEVPLGYADVVTLFHVFEHLPRPLESLAEIRGRMADGGKIVIEVPHAKDFLMSFLDLEDFKAFTFWSEHLILHTRESLTVLLDAAGFGSVAVTGIQRYPLANHLHWLAGKGPGGHETWGHLRTPELDSAYQQMLAGLDQTDTLIAVATK